MKDASGKCRTCDAPTRQFSKGGWRIFCESCDSTTCKCGRPKNRGRKGCYACHIDSRRSTSILATKPFICEFCKEPFGRRIRKNPAEDANRFCSRQCAFASQTSLASEAKTRTNAVLALAHSKPRMCALCKASFAPLSITQRYCGDACQREIERLRAEAKWSNGRTTRRYVRTAPARSYDCRQCGKTFFSVNSHPGYCSVYCRQTQAKAVRRTRLSAFPAEGVSVSYLWERDGGVCHLCGIPVMADAAVPHPMAPTIDHIVPVSKGGAHTRANTALAHFVCNSMKGDSLHVQRPRMIG